jgi:hypothetical protein
MAVESGFDTSEIEEFNDEMVQLAQVEFPRETKAFLRREANALNRNARKGYRSETKKKTGNLLRGLTHGAPYLYNGDEYQIRAKNTAPHAHLIEYGHHLTTIPVTSSNGQVLYIKSNKERNVEGKHIMGRADIQFKNIFPDDVGKFIDEMLEKGLR